MLDYALHQPFDEPRLNVDMVELLLHYDADPNQPVHRNEGRSVWVLFLLSLREYHVRDNGRDRSTCQNLDETWYQVCRALVQAGACSICISTRSHPDQNAWFILKLVFGRDRAAILEQGMERNENEAQQSTSSCVAM